MDINALTTTQTMLQTKLLQTSETSFSTNSCSFNQGHVDVSISCAGKLMETFAGMSENDKQEMDDFRETMMDVIKSGSFDAETMAENAPEQLKSFAEENGIDLEEMLTAMPKRGLPPQGPSPRMSEATDIEMMDMLSSMSEEDLEELQEFYEEMMESVRSRTFDAAETAETAPEQLKTFAEENDINLEEMLTAQVEHGRPPQGPPPQGAAPMTGRHPTFYDSTGAGISNTEEDQTLRLLEGWLSNENNSMASLLVA